MTGQLPAEFFEEFFKILKFSRQDAAQFRAQLEDLSQRKFLKAQLEVLPEMEQNTFSKILQQDSISASTINEFLSQRIDAELRQSLWQESLVYVWQEVLNTIKESATPEQKDQIKELVHIYMVKYHA